MEPVFPKPTLSFNTYVQLARRCTKPRLQRDMIPQLLQALCVIETLRKLSLETCAVALTFDDWYNQSKARNVPLTPGERRLLEEHRKIHSSFRKAYITMLQQLCQVDIYYLWLRAVEKPELAPEVAMRFYQHFTSLCRGCAKPPPSPFYNDLAGSEEMDDLAEAGSNIAAYIAQSQAAAQRGRKSQDLQTHMQTQHFLEQWPCPFEEESLCAVIGLYLDASAKMIHDLEDIFDPDKDL